MYVCKIPTLEEMNRKWDFEIAGAGPDRENWVRWKQGHITRFLSGKQIPYYGILNGQIICKATACIHPEGVQNPQGLVDDRTAYLCAFRTAEGYRGQGWFSRLFRHMTEDLANRGFRRVTLGVEPEERENLAVYRHLGFTEYIKRGEEFFPDGTAIRVDYYGKEIAMELKTMSGFVVKAEKDGDVYCPICHKVLSVKEGQPIPRCCGKPMERMD